MQVLHGKIHGRTVELEEDPGLADGQGVEITLRAVPSGEGFLRTEGALADDPHWGAIMEEVYQERKRDTRREAPE